MDELLKEDGGRITQESSIGDWILLESSSLIQEVGPFDSNRTLDRMPWDGPADRARQHRGNFMENE